MRNAGIAAFIILACRLAAIGGQVAQKPPGPIIVPPGLEKGPSKPERKPGPPGPWADELRKKLEKKITFEVKDATLIEACQKLARLANCPIVVDPAIARDTRKHSVLKVTLRADLMLRWICRYWNARYGLRDGVVLVTQRQAGPEPLKPLAKTYDIGDLLHPSLDRGRRGADKEPRREECGRGWPYYIRAIIAPWAWGRHDDAFTTVTYWRERLTVLHTKRVHDAVQKLLADFRKNRNRQIHVVARLLQLPADALDELKLEYLPCGPRRLSVPRYAPLPSGKASKLMGDILKKVRKGTLLQVHRLTCFNGQYAYVQTGMRRSYVRPIEEEDKLSFPKAWRMAVQPFLTPDGKHITLVFDSPLVAPPDAHPDSRGRAVKIPSLAHFGRLAITIPDGGTILFHYPPGAFAEHVGPEEQAKDAAKQCLVIILTAERVGDIFEEE